MPTAPQVRYHVKRHILRHQQMNYNLYCSIKMPKLLFSLCEEKTVLEKWLLFNWQLILTISLAKTHFLSANLNILLRGKAVPIWSHTPWLDKLYLVNSLFHPKNCCGTNNCHFIISMNVNSRISLLMYKEIHKFRLWDTWWSFLITELLSASCKPQCWRTNFHIFIEQCSNLEPQRQKGRTTMQHW